MNPIADLTYRNYDGPLDPPRFRWWAIARTVIRIAFKKRFTWVLSILSAWYYLGMIFILFITDAMSAQTPAGVVSPFEQYINRIVWRDQFIHGISFGQILFMAISLILGAGAISNDNRANALLVYLSKPVTKLDYLVGKWVGVFLPLWLMMLIPSLVFFLYGMMSYQSKGFISDDPWMFGQLMVALPIIAAFHASLIIGTSSLFNQGRIAGATYAGIYFLTNFFTVLMSIIHSGSSRHAPTAKVVDQLFYASIDGLCIGVSKALLHTTGSPMFGIPASGARGVPPPALGPTLGVMGLIAGGMMFIAWSRIRAVEVVG